MDRAYRLVAYGVHRDCEKPGCDGDYKFTGQAAAGAADGGGPRRAQAGAERMSGAILFGVGPFDVVQPGEKMKLYQYAILYHPLPTKEQTERGEKPKSEIIKDITSIIANDDKGAGMIVARGIPDTFIDKLDQVEIILKPF